MRGERDPAADDKDRAEREWQTALLQFFGEQVQRIEDKLKPGIPRSRRKATGNPADRLDDAFWADEEAALLALIMTLLREAAEAGAAMQAGLIESELAIGFDWTMANANAVEWARQHAGELIKGITDTTREGVARAVSSWLDTAGSTMGDLFGQLEGGYGFSEARARLIAITEVTGAYAEGQMQVWQELYDSGLFDVAIIWQTNKDELVCPVCNSLDGQNVGGGAAERPPAHPNCRCWLTFGVEMRE